MCLSVPSKGFGNRWKRCVSEFGGVKRRVRLLRLLEMIKKKEHSVINNYPQVVKYIGNPKAKHILTEVFEICDVGWRGFPIIPNSGLVIRDEFACCDAKKIHAPS